MCNLVFLSNCRSIVIARRRRPPKQSLISLEIASPPVAARNDMARWVVTFLSRLGPS